ncbi:hypothetical protein KFV02_07120 [Desulfohalobiaceae bacterium Ax17]|uniref:hypothetical protein n=1 Tax=Desulfovulcanus ferrireducens TaxID=2831190 RepID=UPI00207B9DD8|nr:hypothetical protein [Desulfovulcanus ferrireducens]MBT8763702.1 hypothetical protein [Desulfovulcanus ferrireducens]
MSNISVQKFSLKQLLVQFPPAIAALVLSVDTWLKHSQKTSLCTSQSCQIVSEYVRFGDTFLIVLGALFFWLLWLLLFFACRYDKKWLWGASFTLLLGSLAFDGGLLGFQFMALKERCALCIGVGLALFFCLVFFAWFRRSLAIAVLGFAVWVGGFTANSVLKFSPKTPQLSELTVFSWPGKETRDWPKFYLFFSLHCDHCSKLMANLAINNPTAFKWHLNPLDAKPSDLQRIAHILAAEKETKNLFLEILRIESLEQVEPISVPEGLEEKIKNVRDYFRGHGYKGVPLLIIDENPGRRVVLSGERYILNYLKKKGIVVTSIVFPRKELSD